MHYLNAEELAALSSPLPPAKLADSMDRLIAPFAIGIQDPKVAPQAIIYGGILTGIAYALGLPEPTVFVENTLDHCDYVMEQVRARYPEKDIREVVTACSMKLGTALDTVRSDLQVAVDTPRVVATPHGDNVIIAQFGVQPEPTPPPLQTG